MPHGGWVFAPDSGGVKIPEAVRRQTEQRIRKYAEEHFAGKYTRLEVRFRGVFCYFDAYTEPDLPPDWTPLEGQGTREEFLERRRDTPLHLGRLRYFGGDRWTFGFFAYSSEKYELSVFPSGDFFGTPEEAFEVAARVYLP